MTFLGEHEDEYESVALCNYTYSSTRPSLGAEDRSYNTVSSIPVERRTLLLLAKHEATRHGHAMRNDVVPIFTLGNPAEVADGTFRQERTDANPGQWQPVLGRYSQPQSPRRAALRVPYFPGHPSLTLQAYQQYQPCFNQPLPRHCGDGRIFLRVTRGRHVSESRLSSCPRSNPHFPCTFFTC